MAPHVTQTGHLNKICNVCKISISSLYFDVTCICDYIVSLHSGFPVLDYITQSQSYTP